MLTTLFNEQLPKAIFFDLDGTLVDSLPDLASAIDSMLIEQKLNPVGAQKTSLWIGNGARKLVLRALAYAQSVSEFEVDCTELEHSLSIFFKYYAACSGSLSKLYPGVLQTLQGLKESGVRLCVITNKPKQFTPVVLFELGISDFFELVLSGDSLDEKKPSPVPILHALKTLKLPKKQVVMVGDSNSDINAANAAGIKSICVTYGYNHGNDPMLLPANHHINHFTELLL